MLTVTNSILLCRKDNGMPAGYCFIEFATESEAERVLKLVNGTTIPGVTPVSFSAACCFMFSKLKTGRLLAKFLFFNSG